MKLNKTLMLLAIVGTLTTAPVTATEADATGPKQSIWQKAGTTLKKVGSTLKEQVIAKRHRKHNLILLALAVAATAAYRSNGSKNTRYKHLNRFDKVSRHILGRIPFFGGQDLFGHYDTVAENKTRRENLYEMLTRPWPSTATDFVNDIRKGGYDDLATSEHPAAAWLTPELLAQAKAAPSKQAAAQILVPGILASEVPFADHAFTEEDWYGMLGRCERPFIKQSHLRAFPDQWEEVPRRPGIYRRKRG